MDDSNKTLKVRRQDTVNAPYNRTLRACGLDALTLRWRVVHMLRTIYTGPNDIMLCARPKFYATVAGKRSHMLRSLGEMPHTQVDISRLIASRSLNELTVKICMLDWWKYGFKSHSKQQVYFY